MAELNKKNDIYRRRFLVLAGGATGLAAFTAMNKSDSWAANNPEIDIAKNGFAGK